MAQLPFIVASQKPQVGSPVLAKTPSPVLGEMANTFAAFADKQITLRRQSDVAKMSLEATKRLTDLEIEFDKDTDYRTASQRFDQQAQAIMADIAKTTNDRTVLAAFQTEYTKLALAKSVNVKKDAWVKEKDAAKATLDDSIETYSRLYADAKNPVEKNLIRQQANQTIVGSGEAGWITREEAGKRRRLFDSRATEAEIAKLGRDPAAAETIVQRLIAGDFKDLDPVARERQIRTWQARADAFDRKAIAWAERADRNAAKALKAESEEAQKDFMVKAMNGKLTIQDVLAKQNVLEPAALKASLAMARGGDGVTDKAIDIELTQSVGQPDFPDRAARAFNAGALAQDRFQQLMATHNTAMKDTRPGAPFKTLRDNISNRLRPSEINYTPIQAKLQQDGIREWDDWNRDNPDATKSQMDEKADEITRRYSQVQVGEMVAATPLPRGYTLGRSEITNNPAAALAALETAARKLNEDVQAGRVSETQAAREYRDIQILEEAAQKKLIEKNAEDKGKGRK